MAEEVESEQSPSGDVTSFWQRIHEHKIIQWGIGYFGAALALAHAAELVAHALHWPDTVWRVLVIGLIVGFPIALTLAWYHGHKGLTQISAGELSIVSVLVLIGAVFFTAALRPSEHGADGGETGVVETHDTPSGDEAAGSEEPPRQGVPVANTLAVLPFANNSSDLEQEHFAVGLADQLRDALSRLDGLTVIGRTSSFRFRGSNEDLRSIGEQLGVEYVVEGSIQRAGNELRITAELSNTRTGYRQWGDTYPGTLSDIFEIQDGITASIAEALQITLGVGDLGRTPGMTRNLEAYEEFLTGQGFYFESRPESIRSAIAHFERAVAIDPTFLPAWFQLANTYVDGALIVPEEAADWTRKSREAAERGRQLAPDSPFALAWNAFESTERGAWREAAPFFEEQLPVLVSGAGADMFAWVAGGMFLTRVGRIDDAIGYLERARTADPLAGSIALRLGDAYASAGGFAEAFAEFDRAETSGEFPLYVRGTAFLAALAAGDREEIERRLALVAPPPAGIDFNRILKGYLDDRAGAGAEIRRLAASEVGAQPLPAVILAQWAGYYGEHETALELLQRHRRFSGVLVSQTIWRPNLAEMRKLPGFKDLVRDLGMVDYWREFEWSDFCRPVGENDFTCE